MMCRKFICLTIFFMLVLGLTAGQARGQMLAAYWDGNYGTAWAGDGSGTRDALAAAGYEILNAAELKVWMDARIAEGGASVVVFCRDSVPDTVAETMSDTCTLRRYLDSGGRIVWYSDIPFYYMANPGNNTWGDAGAPAILGFNTSSAPRSDTAPYNAITITADGVEWGITESWGSQRAADPTLVDVILATDSNGNAPAWVKFYGDNDSGAFVRLRDTGGQANIDDIMRVATYGLGGNPYARSPSPEDEALLTEFAMGILGTTLRWKPGDFVDTHDVYFGEDFDDVNDGTGDTFIVNQTDTYLIVGYGFTPNDPLPDGLVPGATYYWRIDEVNDTDPNSPWKGDIWSFSLPPTKAYDPTPTDESKYIDPNADLSWVPGFGGVVQTVYLDEDYDAVNNGTA
ncbi:MAG: hypothetical protein ACYTFW_26440 [Planctomycetota bacterium]